jgi:hypothetical protein
MFPAFTGTVSATIGIQIICVEQIDSHGVIQAAEIALACIVRATTKIYVEEGSRNPGKTRGREEPAQPGQVGEPKDEIMKCKDFNINARNSRKTGTQTS